jgi:serine/threonine-protein kinase
VNLSGWIAELRRRRVFRALVGYGIAAFAVLQVIEPVMHGLHLPEVTLSITVVLLGLGFPVTVLLAWAFDLGPAGIERTAPAPAGAAAAPEETLAPAATPGLQARRGLALVALGLLVAAPGVAWFFWSRARPAPAGPASVAVLPFADLSPGKDQGYFSDGLAEEILDALSQVPGLRVPGRISSFSFKGKEVALADIGQQLRVGSVLEGSVRREGARVRITAELVNVTDGYRMWSQTFDRELTGVFEVQQEIARAVVAAMRDRVGAGATPVARPTAAPEAYTAYLLGRQFLNRRNNADYERARRELARAVELDPGYAPAWSALAVAQFWVADAAPTLAEARAGYARALEAADRGIALGPELADGYAARGFLRATQWQWDGARADIERALALNPGSAEAHRYAAVVVHEPRGDFGRARDESWTAIELDPLSAPAWYSYGTYLMEEGRYDEARTALQRSLEIQPEQNFAACELAVDELFAHRPREALAAAGRSAYDVFRLMAEAMAHHDLGDRAASDRALDELTRRFGHAAALQIAETHAWRGERELAIAWLERAVAQRDAGMSGIRNAHLRNLRGDPRYEDILRRVGVADLRR